MITISFVSNIKKIASVVRDIASEQMARDKNSKLAMGSGWSGPKTLLDDPRCDVLSETLGEGVSDQISRTFSTISAWINVLHEGQDIKPHDHPLSHLGGKNDLSGILYTEISGCCAPLIVYDEEIRYHASLSPEPGTLVLFPATTVHEVPMHRCTHPRVSVAFNVKKTIGGMMRFGPYGS